MTVENIPRKYAGWSRAHDRWIIIRTRPITVRARHMRSPTMWYVRPAKPQISLCICAV